MIIWSWLIRSYSLRSDETLQFYVIFIFQQERNSIKNPVYLKYKMENTTNRGFVSEVSYNINAMM